MGKDETLDAYLKRFEMDLAVLNALNIPLDLITVTNIFQKGLNPDRYLDIVANIKSFREKPIHDYLELYEILKTREETIKGAHQHHGTDKKHAASSYVAATSKKYCSYHKTTTHDTKDCRALKGKQGGHKTGHNHPKKPSFPPHWCKFCARKVTNHTEAFCFKNPASKNQRPSKQTVAKVAVTEQVPTPMNSTTYMLQQSNEV